MSLTFGMLVFATNDAKAQIEVDPCLAPVLAYYPNIPLDCQGFEIISISGKTVTANACGVEIKFVLSNNAQNFLFPGTFVSFCALQVTSTSVNGVLKISIG